MADYTRLPADKWSKWLNEIMELHAWTIAQVAKLSQHPASAVGYWKAGQRAPYLHTQIQVRQVLEAQPWPKMIDKKFTKAFEEKWAT